MTNINTGVNNVLIAGGGYDFDGGDYVLFGSPVAPLGGKTYGVWIKAGVIGLNKSILDTGGAASAYRGDWISESATGQIRWWHSKGVTPFNFNLTSTKTLDTNWHYIVCTWDGTTSANAVKMYWDGILEVQGTAITTETITQTNNLRIGVYYWNSTLYSFFNGSIDDVRIYNYARTPSQIQQDYNAGVATHFR